MKNIHVKAGAILLSVLCTAAGADEPAAGPAAIPADTFFSIEDMDEPVMSPSGDAVAIRVRNDKGRRQLAILDTADFTRIKVVASFSNADVARVSWVDDQRLLYQGWSQTDSAYDSRVHGIMAVDRDGAHQLNVGFTSNEVAEQAHGRAALRQLVRTLDDGTGDVVSAEWAHTYKSGYGNRWIDSVPKRYDTRHGTAAELVHGPVPHGIQQWIIDEHGAVRGGISEANGETALYVPDAQGTWGVSVRFPTWGKSGDKFTLVGLATDGQTYVSHSSGGTGGALGLYRLDLQTGKIDPTPVVTARGFDLSPTLIEDRRQHKVIGVRFVTDAENTVWFDARMKALQEKIDGKLKGRINRIDPAACGCARRVLVTSFSDHQPAIYYLYDVGDDSLFQIGASRPQVDPHLAADTDFFRIKARDGHDLPVYVTKPRGKGPWPAVVLVHGGPFMRGWKWEWDGESQFFASRGYVVVKPEFRGSDGYGDELRSSGYRQWGLKMQDDIADATQWAATQGLADPARACIVGGSYGGYAVLMGLVRYPELYRCGVASSAVTDLTLMHDLYWSDLGDEYLAYGMPVLVGDPVKDAAQFAQTSPLQQAARIKRPLLLAHGALDRRVPIDQAIKLRNALESAHAPVTWIEYKDEAHGWFKPETRVEYYERVASFLAANLDPSAAAGASAQAR